MADDGIINPMGAGQQRLVGSPSTMGIRSEGEQKSGGAAGRLLITGAGGFCGSHAVRHFAAAGYEVHAVVRPGSLAERASGALTSAIAESAESAVLPLAAGSAGRLKSLSIPAIWATGRQCWSWYPALLPMRYCIWPAPMRQDRRGGIRRRSWRRTSWEPSICWRLSEPPDASAVYSLPAPCWAAGCPTMLPRSRPILIA